MRLIHGKTTHSILSAAYRVHSRLGPGLLERPYHVCLRHELERMGTQVESEKTLPVVYEGIVIEMGYRLDLLIDQSVIVEVKSVESLLPIHEAQLLTYLRLSGKRVGLLLNFNVVRLREGIRRRVLGYEDNRGAPLA
jgi:GxxExxY protein